MQFLGMTVAICKSEHQGFKKARENMGQCMSGGKDFKRDYAKEKLRENKDNETLRKEVLKNSEARF
jgi:hypothetical protein